MATTGDLVRLFTAIAENDSGSIKKIASQIAEGEFKRGKTSAARMLLSALEVVAKDNSFSDVVFPQVNQFLRRIDSTATLKKLFCRPKTREELVSIIEEQLAKHELKSNGLQPRNKILLYGPPGCGKTFAATAIGNELRLPVYLVQFDSLIGSYLGQTSQNLRQLFDFAEKVPSVILIDEVDAIAFQRGNPNDVGELNRIVISFMQQLEHLNPAGLIICSTNLFKSLDSALTRRFDLAIEFPGPTANEKKQFAVSQARKYGVQNTGSIGKNSASFAEIENKIKAVARKRIVATNRKGEG